MILHVGLLSGTYVIRKAAASGFANPYALTMARAFGAALIFFALTGLIIPRPDFTAKE